MEHFSKKNITDRIICISDVTNVHMYLVLGTDRAALIDTGTGAGDLFGYVKSITSLPITVLLTHGHCDHAGGAAPFDEVYLPDEDMELVKVHASMDRKTEYIGFSGGKDFPVDMICAEREKPYLSLTDGMEFDLGGITLKALKLPGHTKGMTCILFKEDRIMLMGDACNPATFLWDEESLTTTEYLRNLEGFRRWDSLYDRVLLSHGDDVFCKKEIIEGAIEVCNEIIAGKDDKIPFKFMDYQELRMAKAIDPLTFQRIDNGLGNIVYNIKKIS